MKPIDAIRLQLKAMELVEGTELEWEDVIRYKPTKKPLAANFEFYYIEDIELALGIIEDKPVWEMDEYWNGDGDHCRATGITLHVKEYWSTCTWFPPALKTAMVELLVEDIEACAAVIEPHRIDLQRSIIEIQTTAERIRKACRKTLKGLK